MDYYIGGDYQAFVNLAVRDQNGTYITGGTARDLSGEGYISITRQFSATPGSTYIANGAHRAFAYLYDYDGYYPYQTFYYDNWWFGYYETQGINVPWYYRFINNGLQSRTRRTQLIPLGNTNDTAIAVIPNDQVVLSSASIYSNSAQSSDGRFIQLTITPSSPSAQQICGEGSGIVPLIVKFKMSDSTRSLSTVRSYARVKGEPPTTNEWFLSSWNFQNLDFSHIPKTGEMKVNIQYRGKGQAIIHNTISLGIAGEYTNNAGFRDPRSVQVICQ